MRAARTTEREAPERTELPTIMPKVRPDADDKKEGVVAHAASSVGTAVAGIVSSDTAKTLISGVSGPGISKFKSASVASTDPFIRLPQDLGGLIICGALVPSVKYPFKGALAFVLSLCLQACFIGYIIDTLAHEWTSPCSTPALIQLAAVYTFGAACLSQFTAFQGMQIALYGTHLKSDEKGEDQFLVRPTSTRMRCVLFFITLIDLTVEIVVFGVGVVFLMTSSSPTDVVLNSVAVNFISEIDEIMLHAFVNKAAQQRLEKYRFNVKVGVDEGDTRLANANRMTRRQARLSSKAPAIWAIVAVAIVGAGQGLAMQQQPGVNCTLIAAKY